MTLVLADLDDFKRVNDAHGHPAGDEVLREFARTLKDCLREIDLAARWGGEEFAVLLPGTDAQGGVTLAERMRSALAERVITSAAGDHIRMTASFGVAEWPGSGMRTTCWLSRIRLCTRQSGAERTASRLPAGRRWSPLAFRPSAQARYNPPLDRAPRHSSEGGPVPIETPSLFADVIQDHLELKRKNSEIEPDLPIDRYKAEDPFDNHPLFKSEEQARIEETMDGEESLPSEPVSLAVAEPEQPTDEDTLWGRSRDFDWGD